MRDERAGVMDSTPQPLPPPPSFPPQPPPIVKSSNWYKISQTLFHVLAGRTWFRRNRHFVGVGAGVLFHR